MGHKPPLTAEERLEIVEVLKRGNLSHRAIAKQFNRSQSTISTIAKDAGITSTHKRKRSPAAKDLEGSFTREERVKFLDRSIGAVDHMFGGGGLTPRELREVAQAAKVLLDARRSEDVREPEERSANRRWIPLEGMGEMEVDADTEVGRAMLKLEEKWAQEDEEEGEQGKAQD
jgi:transposase-like protein